MTQEASYSRALNPISYMEKLPLLLSAAAKLSNILPRWFVIVYTDPQVLLTGLRKANLLMQAHRMLTGTHLNGLCQLCNATASSTKQNLFRNLLQFDTGNSSAANPILTHALPAYFEPTRHNDGVS
jgi:hypothetical protein